ncbi:40S ribosomal protein S27 [Bonamia ostreae]|uniref:40S ribosomal protein S27 n=1 Tax=Bonamia ostreae TaxID=126728 RepID=A0ABV2ARF5_9EUKA
MPVDLLYPDPQEEQRKHKLKRLVMRPNSFFLDAVCDTCNTMFHLLKPTELLFSATLRQSFFVRSAIKSCPSHLAAKRELVKA